MTRLFILTSADNFTTCCDGTMRALDDEVARCRLRGPVRVDSWYRDFVHTDNEWQRAETFQWR